MALPRGYKWIRIRSGTYGLWSGHSTQGEPLAEISNEDPDVVGWSVYLPKGRWWTLRTLKEAKEEAQWKLGLVTGFRANPVGERRYGVRFTGFKGNYLAEKEKWFPTEAAMQRWLEKNAGDIVEVIAYSYPDRR